MLHLYQSERIDKCTYLKIEQCIFESELPYKNGNQIYNILETNKELRDIKINGKNIDYTYILEIWCKLHNVEHFKLDWDIESMMRYHFIQKKLFSVKNNIKINNKRVLIVIFDILSLYYKEIWVKYCNSVNY